MNLVQYYINLVYLCRVYSEVYRCLSACVDAARRYSVIQIEARGLLAVMTAIMSCANSAALVGSTAIPTLVWGKFGRGIQRVLVGLKPKTMFFGVLNLGKGTWQDSGALVPIVGQNIHPLALPNVIARAINVSLPTVVVRSQRGFTFRKVSTLPSSPHRMMGVPFADVSLMGIGSLSTTIMQLAKYAACFVSNVIAGLVTSVIILSCYERQLCTSKGGSD